MLCGILTFSLAGRCAPVDDAELERHVMALSEQLRCLVCQNQTIADSHADLAIDLRNQVREKIRAGESDQQIYAYMTARYGDFILYRPPLHATTGLLWFGPFLVFVAGLVLLFLRLRKHQNEIDENQTDETPADGDAQ